MPSSLLFDGDDQFVELGSITAGNPLMLNGSDLTILAWIKWLTGDDFQRIFDKSTAGNGTGGYCFNVQGAGGARTLSGSVNGSVYEVKGSLNGVWVPVSFHATSSAHRITANGETLAGAFTSGSASQPPNTTANARIGTWNHSTGREFKGNLRDIVVYPADLTNEQVRQWIVDGTLPGTPAGRWLLEDGSGTDAVDETGNNDGVLTNGPTWSADYPWMLDKFGGGGGGRPRIGNIW